MKIHILTLVTCFMLGNSLFAGSFTPEAEIGLQKAGKNRPELEKVLEHYRSDSTKYRAACFLISNMGVHTSKTYYWADSLNKTVPFNEFDYPDFKTSVNEFNKISKKQKLHPVVVYTPDVENISADYLIKNIDDAFSQRIKSWNSHLSDDVFYDYLLSYRVMNEKHEPWRNEFRDTFSSYFGLIKEQNVRKVCTVLSDSLRGWFYNTYFLKNQKNEPAYLSPKQILFRRQGACEDMADWGVYLLRSIGIAATVDFTPAWATSTGNHYWNVAFDELGNEIPFFMGDDNPNQFRMVREPSKVFRITYQSQTNCLANNISENEIPEGVLRNKNYIDVTDQYWKTAEIDINTPDTIQQKVVYIAVFNGLRWKPVWWAWIKDKQAKFDKCTCGVVYLPFYYSEGKIIPFSYPHLLRADNSVEKLQPDYKNKRTVIIEEQENYLKFRTNKKYTLLYWDKKWNRVNTLIAGTEKKLIFNNVPANALLLLLPEYSQGKERPFIINNDGVREWW